MIKVYISIDVADLKQAETFYIGALGCIKLRDQGADMVVLSTENCELFTGKSSRKKPFQDKRNTP